MPGRPRPSDRRQTRSFEVQVLASEIRILESGQQIAVHPVLAGRDRRSLLQGHRRQPKGTSTAGNDARLRGQANRRGARLSEGCNPPTPVTHATALPGLAPVEALA